MQAVWNNRIIAESDDIVIVEGTPYFPFESVNHSALEASSTVADAPDKGHARYYSIVVDDQTLPDAAFSYANARGAVRPVQGRIAFGRDVKVVDSYRPAVHFVSGRAGAEARPGA